MAKEFDNALSAACGAALGAGMFYLLDAQSGGTRRARLKGKALHAFKRFGDGIGSAAADVAGRSHGVAPRLRRTLARGGPPVDDRVLVERVRAKLGRYVSHPRSIHVISSGGRVTLSGPVVAREIPALLAHVRRVPGVKSVEDALMPHEKTAGVPGLQGGSTRRGERPEPLQESWSPAFRLLAGVAGAVGAYRGIRAGTGAGWLAAAAGTGLMARSWYNEPIRRILGIGYGPAAVRLRKTINIDAPLDVVFRAFASYDNFPLFMPHVREVRDLGDGRSHWKVQALPGTSVEWDAELTELVADRSLGWTSLAGAAVPNAGIIRFSPNARGGTAVDIRLGYHPPAGELGHAFARLLGADPKRKLDRDLMIMKDFIERHAAATGASSRAGARG